MEDQILFFQQFKPHLYERFCRIATARQASLRLIMEDVFKPGNLGAIARSCDAFGIQQIEYRATHHLTKHERILSHTSKGANQWLTYQRFEDTASHIDQLHREGWHILATSSVEEGKPLDAVDFAAYPKLALMVGSESAGLSDVALNKADQHITIPMHGFVESFNVSVATALVLQEIVRKRQAPSFFLDEAGQQALVRQFIAIYFKKHPSQLPQ